MFKTENLHFSNLDNSHIWIPIGSTFRKKEATDGHMGQLQRLYIV